MIDDGTMRWGKGTGTCACMHSDGGSMKVRRKALSSHCAFLLCSSGEPIQTGLSPPGPMFSAAPTERAVKVEADRHGGGAAVAVAVGRHHAQGSPLQSRAGGVGNGSSVRPEGVQLPALLNVLRDGGVGVKRGCIALADRL